MVHQRGSLTPEQAALVIRSLPVDLSFADENDVIVFWQGETYRDCDDGYIGQDVRSCHADKTQGVLEEILRELKAGRRDVAVSLHREKDVLLYTRYYAMRDDAGAYRGILEVNQDIASIRALEGEQRLPGW